MPIGKTDAILGQLIDIRSADIIRSLIPKVCPTKIIGKKDDDVGFVASLKSNCEVAGKEKGKFFIMDFSRANRRYPFGTVRREGRFWK